MRFAIPNAPRAAPVSPKDRRYGRLAVALVVLLFVFVALELNEFLGVELLKERPIKLTLLIGGGFLIFSRFDFARQLLLGSVNRYLLLFIALGWLSVLWSIEPGLTLLRMLTFTAYTLTLTAFCLYRWSRERFQRVMRQILLAIPLLSMAVWLVDPAFVVEVGDDISLRGSWKGLTGQKNTFGQLAAFSTMLWMHALLTRETARRTAWIGLAISFWAVLLSRSSTSLLASVPTCGFLWLLLRSPPSLKRYMPYISTVFALLVVTYSMAVLKLVPGLELLLKPIAMITGKDLTFSGRSLIWDVIRQHISFAPLLGTGFGAYWAGPTFLLSPSQEVARVMYIYPYQAHNGYLDVINDLGYVGLLVLIGYMIVFMRQSLQLFRIDRHQGALYLAMFFMVAISNLSQSIWFTFNVEFIVMTFATLALGRTMLEHRLRAAQQARQVQPRPAWQRWQ